MKYKKEQVQETRESLGNTERMCKGVVVQEVKRSKVKAGKESRMRRVMRKEGAYGRKNI